MTDTLVRLRFGAGRFARIVIRYRSYVCAVAEKSVGGCKEALVAGERLSLWTARARLSVL
jgi:hypothetical protein